MGVGVQRAKRSGRERVLVLDRSRLTAEAVAAALGGDAVGMVAADVEQWFLAGDTAFSVAVVDARLLSKPLLSLLSTELSGAPVVLLVADEKYVPQQPHRRPVTQVAVRRHDGIDTLRRRVGALVDPTAPTAGVPDAQSTDAFGLTAREQEVAALMTAGWSNDAIASELAVSVHTVRSHVQRILLKLAVPNRFAAADALRPRLGHPRTSYESPALVEGGAG
jgi:DNA-binding CsgD family transcriptional regulator